MKDYYKLFVELSLKQCTKDDYADKAKIKMHNIASEKLNQLQVEMKHDCADEVVCKLLSHEDDRVKINAASLCLRMDTLVDQAMQVLKNIIDNSSDSTMCFAAKMLLAETDCGQGDCSPAT